jgi:hypothetical protein
MSQKIGFNVMANFLFCLPNESKDDRAACVDFAISNKIDLAKFNNVVPYPGTQMYDDLIANNKLNVLTDYSNFNSQEVLVRPIFKKRNFPYIPENTSVYGIEKEIIFAYFRYYFRIKVFAKMLMQSNWGDAILSSGDSFVSKLKKLPAFLLLLTDISIKFGLMFLSVFRKDGIKLSSLLKTLPTFFK